MNYEEFKNEFVEALQERLYITTIQRQKDGEYRDSEWEQSRDSSWNF